MNDGIVESFDDHVGLGVIRGSGGEAYPFHCTRIAGGVRTIEPGTTVTFEIVAGHRGQWEATDVTATR